MAIPAPGGAPSGTWLGDNWDKVATMFVSVVLSGVIGFFSAVISIRSEISDLRDKVAQIDAEVKTSLLPKTATTDQNTKDIVGVQDKLSDIAKQTDLAIQMNKILDLRIEDVRQHLIKELKEFYDDVTAKTGVNRHGTTR
jgi:hypothetical protein